MLLASFEETVQFAGISACCAKRSINVVVRVDAIAPACAACPRAHILAPWQ
jgi:hypothetical protein